ALEDSEGEEGEGLHSVEELGVAITIEALGLISEARRGRPLAPFAAVDHEPTLSRELGHSPVADDRLELGGPATRLILLEGDDLGIGNSCSWGEKRKHNESASHGVLLLGRVTNQPMTMKSSGRPAYATRSVMLRRLPSMTSG